MVNAANALLILSFFCFALGLSGGIINNPPDGYRGPYFGPFLLLAAAFGMFLGSIVLRGRPLFAG